MNDNLKEKYPLIFSKPCEISTGDGWYNIIDNLCANIQDYIQNNAYRIKYAKKYNAELAIAEKNNFEDWPEWKSREVQPIPQEVEQVVATQVKEKFGGLRFHYNGGDSYIAGLVSMSESMSECTCEVCGAPGRIRDGGWIRALCDEHAEN